MKEKGFALVTSLILLTVLMALLTAYFTLTRIELQTTSASAAQTSGFYAAEAGLNLRAEDVRQKFLGYNRPSGTSPNATNPCDGNNQGSGDFACQTYTISGRKVVTYVVEDTRNPQIIRIPPGELYQNLNAQEYRYSVYSVSQGRDGRPEAMLEMVFKSRLVPMFQFAAFYNKDLEILPGPPMTLNGPVHTNGDLYLNAENTLTITGQVSSAGDVFRGRKNVNQCKGTVQIYDHANQPRTINCNGVGTRQVPQSELNAWGGMIRTRVESVTVPSPETLEPRSGNIYWDKADLRLGLDLSTNPPQVRVYGPNGLPDPLLSTPLNACPGSINGKAVGYSHTFPNRRESRTRNQDIQIRMLEVDLRSLLDCIHSYNLLGPGKGLDDATEGGLVFHLTVFGPDSSGVNDYGVRIRNAAEIAASIPGAPRPRGLTLVTDQAIYLQGDFNARNKIPTAVLADSLNVLSNGWNNQREGNLNPQGTDQPPAQSTTINAAFLAGTDKTGGAEGSLGRFQGNYNGGLENYPRFHENWSSTTLTYRGSFVSLGEPKHVNGRWENQVYTPPTRDWAYDTDFSDAAKLPPLSPRFVYLKQDLFVRQFER